MNLKIKFESMSTIDFIIVTKNQIHYTRQCIESIFAHVRCPFHLILIDNASTDGTRQYYEDLKKRASGSVQVTVVFNESNVGYVLGVNQGLRLSKSPYVVLSNNDVVVYPDAVEELIRVADSKPGFGLINPNSNEFGFPKYDEKKLTKLKGAYRERCHISGFFVLIKRAVIEKIGEYDSIYSPGYFEEMDYSERAKRAGFLPMVACGAYVHHYGSRSFMPKEKQDAWNKNQLVFDKRWGGTKWFAYVGDWRTIKNEEKRKQIIEKLVLIAREHSAMIYLFLPFGTKKYFKNIHDGFRFVETLPGLTSILLNIKLRRAKKKKPISVIYASDDKVGWIKKTAVKYGASIQILSV